ncbi:MAG: hypothetical protein AAF417_20545 [Pseudomonadota bacterium]
MRAIPLVFLTNMLVLFAAVSHADALTAEETAAQAFYYQTQDQYFEMLQLYDPAPIAELGEAFRYTLTKEDDWDGERKAFLIQVFGSDDEERLMRLSSIEVIAHLFNFLFTSQLSAEEREVLKAGQFRTVGTEQTEEGLTSVLYIVDFSAAGGGETDVKRMNLRQTDGVWQIVIDPQIASVLAQIARAL